MPLMGSGKLVISIGKDEFNMTNMTANAGGALGYQSGKAVAYCTLSPDQPYDAIEKTDSYTLKVVCSEPEQHLRLLSNVRKCLHRQLRKPDNRARMLEKL